MSIQLPEAASALSDEGGDPFGTALLTRLIREEFGRGALPRKLPSSPATTAEPAASGLTGGFPAASSAGPPPVHPGVVAAEPEPQQARSGGSYETYSGEEESGTHEFGEPHSFLDGGFSTPRRSTSRPGGGVHGAPASGSGLALPGFSPDAGYAPLYYIKDRPGSLIPALPGAESPGAGASAEAFDVDGIRAQFPALHQRVNGKPLIWLDNAATTHKPQAVLDATAEFYGRDNSNIHRAAHTLAERATQIFENGREKVREFLGAADAKEIIFVRGTTEGINLVAQTYGRKHIGQGDEILLTQLEHHANIVPWQLLAEQTGARLRVIPINDRGELLLEELPRLLTERTKIVSVTHVSNALGTVNPVEEIIAASHSRGIPVVVDGAQSTPHLPVNVQALNADFFVFSGHKVFGPTGIGAVYGKAALLETLPPWQGGGHMIRDVTFERTVYQNAPERFEAGTPDIAGVAGLAAALDFLLQTGIPAIAAYEHALLEYATAALATVPGLRAIGTAANKASVLGFVIPGLENERIAKHLDQHGIAVRAGHHCAMPAVRHFGVESTVRPSLAFYNTPQEVDTFIRVLKSLPRH